MLDKTIVRSFLIAAAFCGVHSAHDPSPASAQDAGASVTTTIPPPDAQTARIVDDANAFLATLSEEQKAAVLFDFKDAEQRARWSNLPEGIFKRTGAAWGGMDEAQRTALTDLLDAVLGPEGVENVREQMAADDALPAPGGAPVRFGSGYYYVSFSGRPSTTSPWMLQFGGHHLAINATVVGPNVTLSPSLTGGQPLKFVSEGRPVYIVLKEAVQGAALLDSLTEAQRAKAVVGNQFIDLVLGAGKDGMTLQPEGLSGAEMDVQQKAQLLALIEARLGIIMNADDRAAKMTGVERDLDQTYFAWWGPAEPLGAAYWRVTGPTVLLEFSPQALGGDPTQHAHNIYRDPTNEYGAAWAPLE
jgi:hypothetical protein